MADTTRTTIRQHAEELGVNPDIAEAIGGQESGYNPNAVSPKGARGVMQVMPATAAELTTRYGPSNIRQGVGYYKEMLDQFRDEKLALAAYNAGPGRVRRAMKRAQLRGLGQDFDSVSRFLPQETQAYVPGVLGRTGVGYNPQQVSVTAGGGDDALARLEKLAGAGADPLNNLRDLARLEELAKGGAPAAPAPTAAAPSEAGRSLGQGVYERTIGRGLSAVNRAFGGAPAAIGGYLGAKSAGDEQLAQEALMQGGSTMDRIVGVGTGLLEAGGTAAMPGAAALSTGAGIAGEALGGKTAGDVAEFATGLRIPQGARAAVRGGKWLAREGKSLLKSGGLKSEIMRDLGSTKGRDAARLGEELRAPGGIGATVSNVTKEGNALFKEAERYADARGLVVSAADKTFEAGLKEAKQISRSTYEDAPKNIKRLLVKIRRTGRSPVIDEAGKKRLGPRKDVKLSEMMRLLSALKRERRLLPNDHVSFASTKKIEATLESAIAEASKNHPELLKKLDVARGFWRTRVQPIKEAGRAVIGAKTPEAGVRNLGNPKLYSRLEALTRENPQQAEQVRQTILKEVFGGKRRHGQVAIDKMSSFLDNLPEAGVDVLFDTPARKLTYKALQGLASKQRLAERGTPVIGRAVRAGLASEKVAHALYRLSKAKAGSPGWSMAKAALNKLLKEGGKTAVSAGRVGSGLAYSEEEE